MSDLATEPGCLHPCFEDEAAARQEAVAQRLAGRAGTRARRCKYCGRWRLQRRGSQGSRKPVQNTWWRVYKYRINHGLERCRECGCRDNLTFAHLVPYSVHRSWAFDNVTILCAPDNNAEGAVMSTRPSLADEEAAAPPERRWSQVGVQLYGLPPRKRSSRGSAA
jgi:5-methylcytosine-specific restriction endonuclease McrA